MAEQANAPRKASAELLAIQIHALKLTCGLVAKATRAYKTLAKSESLTQEAVATASSLAQPQVSDFENGKFIPSNAELDKLLTACGFDLNLPGGKSYRDLLKFLRDSAEDLKELPKELPD